MKRLPTGFSLFEVMIAMAVCVTGMALVIKMLATSDAFYHRAEENSQMQMWCHNRMQQIALGLVPVAEVRRQECEALEGYCYSIHTEPHPQFPAHWVEVTVWLDPSKLSTGSELTNSRSVSRPRREFRLQRLIPNPRNSSERGLTDSPSMGPSNGIPFHDPLQSRS